MGDRNSEVVITGAGVCCNMGDDLDAIETALQGGDSPAFEVFPEAVEYGARCQIYGAYHGDLDNAALDISKAEGRFMGRGARMALRAARAALAMSGRDPRDLAVIVGSGAGDVATHVEIRRALDQHGARRVAPTVIPRLMASTVSANLVNVLRTTGPSMSATAACAGGAYNLLLAAQMIQTGHAPAALAGGVEAADMHFFAGFDAMRAYNGSDNDAPHRASRPYAADRAGFIFGEGAGVVVLERRDRAEARGAEILGVVSGFGMSSDGEGQMVAPSPEGAYRAMRQALSVAGLSPSDIDYVNTHGTSTPVGDVSEVRALRRLLDDRHVAYSSTKGYTGHTITAAGALEAIFTISMLRRGFVAPSVHADPLDPELADFPPVFQPEARQLRHAISNSFGFGGTNVAMILSAS